MLTTSNAASPQSTVTGFKDVGNAAAVAPSKAVDMAGRMSLSTEVGGGATNATFDANVERVMDIMINSLYDTPEVFLRELVSNASDALDKRQFAETSGETETSDDPYEISVVPNADQGTLAISDSGIGMTRSELVENLGRIGESGTEKFSTRLSSTDSIGHFGVGFYSAFLVADRVTVHTRTPKDGDYVWTSDGVRYDVRSDTDSPITETRVSGTVIRLQLKPDRTAEYTNATRLKDILTKYSQFLHHRVTLRRVEDRRMPDGKGGHSTKHMASWDVITKVPPIWTVESPTDQDHDKFCRALTGQQDHIARDFFRVEGDFSFSVAMYVPTTCSFDLFSATRDRHARNTRLFCRGVFVTDDCSEVCPSWLSFLQVAVSADDLDLHVGRSGMQHRMLLSVIEKQVVQHAVAMLEALSQTEKWDDFWSRYSRELRLGAHDDERHRERLARLCAWKTVLRPNENAVTLKDFVESLEADVPVYYVTGQGSADQISNLPCVEGLVAHGVNALIFNEPIDAYVALRLTQVSGRQVVNVGAVGTKFPWSQGEPDNTSDKLCTALQKMLGCSVQLTDALSSSPCCVVTQAGTHTAYMRQIMSSQAMGKVDIPPESCAVLLNPTHDIVRGLQQRLTQLCDNTGETTASEFESTVRFLVDTARLASGFEMKDRQAHVRQVWSHFKL